MYIIIFNKEFSEKQVWKNIVKYRYGKLHNISEEKKWKNEILTNYGRRIKFYKLNLKN
jgi:hypothetical protein